MTTEGGRGIGVYNVAQFYVWYFSEQSPTLQYCGDIKLCGVQ